MVPAFTVVEAGEYELSRTLTSFALAGVPGVLGDPGGFGFVGA